MQTTTRPYKGEGREGGGEEERERKREREGERGCEEKREGVKRREEKDNICVESSEDRLRARAADRTVGCHESIGHIYKFNTL